MILCRKQPPPANPYLVISTEASQTHRDAQWSDLQAARCGDAAIGTRTLQVSPLQPQRARLSVEMTDFRHVKTLKRM